MNSTLDSLLYITFYLFPLVMLLLGAKFKPNFTIFPFPLKMVDLITPYLLLSVTIQSNLAGFEAAHLYFYIFLSVFGIVYASYLAFSKRLLIVGTFFRTWWRYAFLFMLIYHLVMGGYGIYVHFF